MFIKDRFYSRPVDKTASPSLESSQVSFDVAFMSVHRLGENTSPSFLCIEQPRFNDSDAKFGLEKLHFYTSSFLIRTTGMKKSIDSQKTDKKC